MASGSALRSNSVERAEQSWQAMRRAESGSSRAGRAPARPVRQRSSLAHRPCDRAPVALTPVSRFDAGNRPCREEADHRMPIVGRCIGQHERDAFRACLLADGTARPAQLARRSPIQRVECRIKATDAAEARRQGDFRHRHGRLDDELLREEHAACLSDRDSRCSEVLPEQPPQLPLTDPEPFR